MSQDTPASCQQCGTCCRKGGPAFHLEDKGLIEDGLIPARHLFTIRQGELAMDNVKGHLVPSATDLVKIKGKGHTWACRYLDDRNRCSMYEHRPLECRVLACWDTREIERIYAVRRLTRKDLLKGVAGLWELVEAHQARCDYAEIRYLKDLLDGPGKINAKKKLRELIAYDRHLRSLVFSKHNMDPGMADFLFGMPLTRTLPRMGIYLAA